MSRVAKKGSTGEGGATEESLEVGGQESSELSSEEDAYMPRNHGAEGR